MIYDSLTLARSTSLSSGERAPIIPMVCPNRVANQQIQNTIIRRTQCLHYVWLGPQNPVSRYLTRAELGLAP